MTGFMTERKLLAMFCEQVGPDMNPIYRSALIAGYYGIDSPCCPENTHCADGFIKGKELRQLILSLGGKTNDKQVEEALAKLAAPSPEDCECVPAEVFVGASWSRARRGWADHLTLAMS